MTVNVRIVVSGMAEAMMKLTEIDDRLAHDKQKAMLNSTNEVATVWRRNFDTEGGMVGGWAELAEATQDRRSYYGYNPDSPILFRYGALRGVAVDFFKDATGGGSTSATDDYSTQTTSAHLELSNGVARMSAQGWKIANQYGYPNTNGSGENPARPFWFVDNNVIAAARKGVEDWLLDDVLR